MMETDTHPQHQNDPALANAAATWDSRFEQAYYIFGTEPNTYLRQHAHLWQTGQRVLCVADGEGRNRVWLASQGLKVDAFDISGRKQSKEAGRGDRSTCRILR